MEIVSNNKECGTEATAPVRILCLGDVVGKTGRRAVQEHAPRLKDFFSLDFSFANGENAAGGFGLTRTTAHELFSAGLDCLTSGNHIWKQQEAQFLLEKEPRILRPANFPPGTPGKGLGLFKLKNGMPIAVINLIGRTYMEAVDCPFRTVEALLKQIPTDITLRLVDFHAEATSEKRALAHFLDGQVTAILGTHTHVQTADAMILPGGTATITDLGMCGCEESSVLGMDKTRSINRFYTAMPGRFIPAKGVGTLNGVLLEADPHSGYALNIRLLRQQGPQTIDYTHLNI